MERGWGKGRGWGRVGEEVGEGLGKGWGGLGFLHLENQKGPEVCYCLWGVPSRPSGSILGPSRSHPRSEVVLSRFAMCFVLQCFGPIQVLRWGPSRPVLVPSCSRAFLPGSGLDGQKQTSWPLPRKPRLKTPVNGPKRIANAEVPERGFSQELTSCCVFLGTLLQTPGRTFSENFCDFGPGGPRDSCKWWLGSQSLEAKTLGAEIPERRRTLSSGLWAGEGSLEILVRLLK